VGKRFEVAPLTAGPGNGYKSAVRRTRLLVVLAVPALAAALALAACGDDTSTTTVTETAGSTEGTDTSATQTGEATAPTSAAAPSGALTSTGVGEVNRGSRTSQVEQLFGPPDRSQKGPGCELSADSQGALAWTYKLAGGRLVLDFDAASGRLGSYRNTSPGLQTTLGDRVGDTFGSVEGNWGGSLKPLLIGTARPSTKAGIWEVKDGRNELLFDFRGGKVAAISGGRIAICE
jgi:hypothetical protein